MFKNYNMFKPCGQYNTANFNQATESYHPMSFYIVEALQKLDHFADMMENGVNDAPGGNMI